MLLHSGHLYMALYKRLHLCTRPVSEPICGWPKKVKEETFRGNTCATVTCEGNTIGLYFSIHYIGRAAKIPFGPNSNPSNLLQLAEPVQKLT